MEEKKERKQEKVKHFLFQCDYSWKYSYTFDNIPLQLSHQQPHTAKVRCIWVYAHTSISSHMSLASLCVQKVMIPQNNSNTGKIQMYFREELSRRSRSSKARLSYQCTSLNFCPSASQHLSPLYAIIIWKHEDLPFAHKVTRLRSKPRPLWAVQRKRHLKLNDTPPDFPP